MLILRNAIYVLLFSNLVLQAQVAQSFKLNAADPDRGGLVGNGITDLLWNDGTLYAGTGFGLSTTTDEGQSWINFTPTEYGGQGGVSALAVGEDGTLWISTAYDTTVEDDQSLSIGGGLRYLEPGSSEWGFIPQPLDARDDTANGKRPTTTRVQNVTFDIAVRGSDELWITSFGGGVRRSTDRGQNWEVITTDGLPFSALDYLNHRGFSVLVDTSDFIWIGTAGQRFTHTNQNSPISGNFVIGLFHNPYDNSIWATTVRALGETEFNAISATANGGLSWTIHLQEELSDGTFPRYVAFYDSAVYVATEKGAYKSVDDGENWLLLPAIRDTKSGEGLFTNIFYSVAASPAIAPFHRLWVGSVDGLATSANNGYDWTVFRSFVSTRNRTNPAVYAYPNPYSPLHSDRPCRFQFDITESGEAFIDIYNFAMEKVTTLRGQIDDLQSGGLDRSIIWDGKDNNNRPVDNGVYFFRANISGKATWGKVVIIN
jgi:photosystem II stability/assembly factor-like uncharacterized protein